MFFLKAPNALLAMLFLKRFEQFLISTGRI